MRTWRPLVYELRLNYQTAHETLVHDLSQTRDARDGWLRIMLNVTTHPMLTSIWVKKKVRQSVILLDPLIIAHEFLSVSMYSKCDSRAAILKMCRTCGWLWRTIKSHRHISTSQQYYFNGRKQSFRSVG